MVGSLLRLYKKIGTDAKVWHLYRLIKYIETFSAASIAGGSLFCCPIMCYNDKVFLRTSMNMQIDLDGENMKVTKEDLENVAVLSRLSVPEGKAETYIQQMDSILTYMDNLSKVDTENVKPTTYALPMQNVFREDVVKPSLPREAALANAPLQEDGYFKVPKVLED